MSPPDRRLTESSRTVKNSSTLPEAFVQRLEEIYPGSECRNVLEVFDLPGSTSFRINTLRANPEEVVEELIAAGLHLHSVAWKPDAYWIGPEEREVLLESAAFKEQRIYIQNLSSMVPPLVLDPQPGEHVLDLAAAPGSKTLQMTAQMKNQGEIAAVELVRSRFFKMQANLEAQGARNVRTFLKNGEQVWRYRPEYFDRVLLDAPCSSEGRFSTNDPDSFAYWSPRKIKEMARKQSRLLFSAIQCLRPGGTLVYSTCTFAPEEDEVIVNRMLEKFGDAIRVEPFELELPNMRRALPGWQGKSFRSDVQHARRILPTETMEGFFVCKLQKYESTIKGR